MKQLICTIALSMAMFQFAEAQNEICYTYDAAGNRTVKNVCCTNCSQTRDETQVEAEAVPGRITVIPNPTNGFFRLETDKIPVEAKVRIFNTAGALVSHRLLGDGIFDLSEFPSGVYMIEIIYNGKRQSALLEKTDF